MKRSNRIVRIMYILALSVTGFLCVTCDTERNIEPQVAFIKYYGGEGNQEAVDIHVNNDGTIILLGTSINNAGSNIFLVKTDYDGNILGTATFGDGAEIARDLEPTLDGNFVVLARTKILGVDSVKLIKISPDLIKIDSIMDGFPGADAFPNTVTAIDQSGVRGFIVTGSTSFVEGESNSISTAMQLRYTDDLEVYSGTWERLYDTGIQNGVVSDVAVRTLQLDDTKFCVFGYTNGFTIPPNYDVWYYQLDEVGSSVDNKSISFASTDILSDVSNSSPLAFGSISTSESAGNKDLVFSRFPINTRVENNQEVVKNLGNPTNTTLSISNSRNFEATKILSKSSGEGYYVVANEIELDNSRNIWVSSVDEAGNVVWSARFGAKENDDRSGGVAELPNGRVLVLGTMNLENQDKLALFNLNTKGRLSN